MKQRPRNDPSTHWSSYWARGCLTSLPQDFQRNYDGEIAEFWHAQFSALPAGASILDVCTGNGAVALLAARFGCRHERGYKISGVDAAHIDPDVVAAAHPALSGLVRQIEFIGDCLFEDLERPDASCDLIVSQYGIEYCDWEASAARAAALLKAGGRLAMVCHAASSDMLATMQSEYAEFRQLEQLKVMAGLDALLHREIGPARFRRILETAAPVLLAEYNRTQSPLYRYVLDMVGQAVRMNDEMLMRHERQLAETRRQLGDGYARLEDMLRVNRAIAADPQWHLIFARHGMVHIDSGDLNYGGRHRAGLFHRYRKP